MLTVIKIRYWVEPNANGQEKIKTDVSESILNANGMLAAQNPSPT